MSHSRPLIVAHRGASHDAPENTLAAFALGLQQGADAIEGDFHLSADGQVICMHDASARRTAGVDRPVAQMSLAEIGQLDVGAWKAPAYTNERVPTLRQVLQMLPAGKSLLLEIKCGMEIVPELQRVITASGRAADVRIICFNADVLSAVKTAMPAVTAYWLTGFKPDDNGTFHPNADEIIDVLKRINADGVDAAGAPEVLTDAAMARLKQAGYEVHVWTVDDPDLARTLAARGVDSITTNRPAFIREALATTNASSR